MNQSINGRKGIVGNVVSDLAWSQTGFLFRVGEIWITCPWAGHPILPLRLPENSWQLSALSQIRRPKRLSLSAWFEDQCAIFTAIHGAIVDVWCEGLDTDLGFNDPGENWFVFEDGHCLTVDHPVPAFGACLPTLLRQDTTTILNRSRIVSFFDVPLHCVEASD